MKSVRFPRIFPRDISRLFSSCPLASAEILKIVVDDTIQPITRGIHCPSRLTKRTRRNDQAVLIQLNTPGGLVDSTREIIEKITNSSRSGNYLCRTQRKPRGLHWNFILESADIAAVAPGNETRGCTSRPPRGTQARRRDEAQN